MVIWTDSCHLNILLFISFLLMTPSVSTEDFLASPPPSFNTTTLQFSVSSLSPFNTTVSLPYSDYYIMAGLDISVEVNNNILEPGTVMDKIT